MGRHASWIERRPTRNGGSVNCQTVHAAKLISNDVFAQWRGGAVRIAKTETAMQIMKWIGRSIIIGGVSLGLGAGFAQPAEARTIGAIAGLAGASTMACLAISSATLTNNCGSVAVIDFPLPIDFGGAKSVTVTGSHPVTTGVQCRATGTNPAATTFFHSNGGAYEALDPALGNIVLTGAFVPGGGQLLVNCHLAPNAKVTVLDWNA